MHVHSVVDFAVRSIRFLNLWVKGAYAAEAKALGGYDKIRIRMIDDEVIVDYLMAYTLAIKFLR